MENSSASNSSQCPPRHVVWPEGYIALPFNLRDDRGAFSKDKNYKILASIFPGTNGISCDGRFLTIIVSELPPKPWPKMIAGLPVYLTTHDGPMTCVIPFGLPTHRRNGSIADYMNGRDMENWTPLFEAVRDHFVAMEISLTRVFYWGSYLFIVLEHRNADTTKLPWKFAQLPCQYMYQDQIGAPGRLQAQRQTDLTSEQPNQDHYDTMQLFRAKQIKPSDLIVLETPDTGCIYGNFLVPAFQRIAINDVHGPEQEWVSAAWLYMGQDCGANLQPGMCRGTIRTENSDAMGFFRYKLAGGRMRDWCIAIAEDELMNRGLVLVDASDQELS